MPSWRPSSGDVSPAGSTIRVAKRSSVSPIEEPRPKKLKLTVRKPSDEHDDIENARPRPKRKSGRPARYFEESEPSITMVSPEDSPPPTTKTTVIEAPAVVETNSEAEPAAYGADFLSMYIEDESPPPVARPAVKRSVETATPTPVTTTAIATPSTTKPATPKKPVLAKPIPQTKETQTVSTVPYAVAAPPQVKDSLETLIKKLSIAVHALSGLNIPAPIMRPVSQPQPPPPPPKQST